MDLSTINIIIYQIFNLILFILSKTVQDTYSFQLKMPMFSVNDTVGF